MTMVIYKGMSKMDDNGQEIKDVKRPTLFPAFHGDEEGVEIIGFFTRDKIQAEYYADNHGENGIVRKFHLKDTDKKLVIDAEFQKAGDVQFAESGKFFRDAIRSGNYDVIEIKNTSDENDILVVLNSEILEPFIKPKRKMRMR